MHATPKRILIVEDEAVIAMHLAETLRSMGYVVAGTAADASQARKLAQDARPDLALMGVQLGGSDGIAACRDIQSGLGIPVVLLTASTDQEVVERASQAAPYGFVTKPFTPAQLRLTLEAALRKRAEEARDDAEHNFRAVFDAVPASVFITDAEDGRILAVNEHFLATRGFTREEVLGHTSVELGLLTEKQRAALRGIMARDNRVESLEFKSMRSTGEVTFLLSSRPHRFAGRECWLTVSQDITRRKQLEEEREAYRSMAEASADFMTLLDASYTYRAANRAYCQTMDRPECEVLGRTVAEVWGQETFERDIKPHLDRAMAGEVVRYEQWFPFHARGRACFDVTYTPLRNRDGEVEFVSVVSHEVTQYKEAEAALKASEERLASILRVSPDIIYRLDPEGRIQYVSAAVAEYGWSPEELLGASIFDLVHPDDRDRARHRLDDRRTGLRRTRFFEARLQAKGGGPAKTFLVDAEGVWGEGGSGAAFLGTQGTARDVTERRAAMDRLRFQAQILDSVGEAVIARDLAHRIIYWSRGAEELYGWTADEVLGRSWAEQALGGDCAGLDARLEQARTQGGWTARTRPRRKDGTRFWADCRGRLLLDEKGEARGTISVARDVTGQVELAERLIANQARLVRAQRLGRIGDWERDMDLGFVHWSDELFRLYGYEPGEFSPDFDFFLQNICHPEDRALVTEPLERMRQGEPEADYAFRFRRKDGSLGHGVSHTRLECDAGGRPCRFVGTVQDVTVSVQDQARLCERTALLDAILEAAPTPVFYKDPSGRYLGCNQAFADLLGQSREQIVGRTAEDILPTGQGRRSMEREADLMAQGGLLEYESTMDTPAGPRRMLLRKALFTAGQGEPPGVVGVMLDLTAHYLAQEELERSQRFLAEGERLARCGTWEVDVATGQGMASDNLSRLLGYEPGEAPSTLDFFFSRVLPDDLPRVMEAWIQGVEQGVAVEVEYRVLTKQGAVRHHQGRAEFAAGPDGRTARAWGAMRDVTRGKLAERDLAEARDLAQAAGRVRSEFLANMSHELRTPLNGILGMAELTLDTVLDQEQRENLGMIRESGRTLLKVLNDILDISRIEAGRVAPEQDRDFDLAGMLADVAAGFKEQASAKGVALQVQSAEGGPQRFAGPEAALRQVLFNLLANAVKFTERGVVQLFASILPHGDAEGRRWVLFGVEDSGPGIPDVALPSLFEPFVQADGSATRKHGGTGLGLALVKRVLSRLGGRLSVDSRPGSGTAIYFSLPLRPAGPAPQSEPIRYGAPPSGLKVLVAEDNAVNRLYAMRLLERLGHQPTGANDGLATLEALGREPFDLVFMDVQMPGMDGVAVTRAVRQGQAGNADPALPIVAMTAHALVGDRERFLAEGMDDYLSKPMEPDALQAVLARVMSRRRAGR